MTDQTNPNAAAVEAAARTAGFTDPAAIVEHIAPADSGTDEARRRALAALADAQPDLLGHDRRIADATTPREVRAAVEQAKQGSPAAAAVREWAREATER